MRAMELKPGQSGIHDRTLVILNILRMGKQGQGTEEQHERKPWPFERFGEFVVHRSGTMESVYSFDCMDSDVSGEVLGDWLVRASGHEGDSADADYPAKEP